MCKCLGALPYHKPILPEHLPVDTMKEVGLKVLIPPKITNWRCWSFEIMLPYFEGFKNHEEFLVMDIVVEFQSGKCSGVKIDRSIFELQKRSIHEGVIY
jgi:hypothetical protein